MNLTEVLDIMVWYEVHKSGITTSVNLYANYDFNSEAKIVNASEFFDFGGLMSAVKAENKK